MEYEQVSSRGVIFPFDDPYRINVYMIETDSQLIICDTGCGPDHMQWVLQYIEQEGKSQQIVIFNSHYHYDHVWGNCAFNDVSIYSHESCYDLLSKEGNESLKKYKNHQRGKVELVLPNILFPNNVILDDGFIELFHTPGHSPDSSSCYDRKDRVLFVGDNIESPFPLLYSPDLNQYIATLTEYLSIEWDVLIASHDPVLNDDRLILKNIEYLERLRNWEVSLSELDEQEKYVHIANLAQMTEMIDTEVFDNKARMCFAEARDYLESVERGPHFEEYLTKLKRVVRYIL